MRSHLLVGTVRHVRLRPRTYAFTHHVYYLALDLDELAEVERRVPVIGIESARPLAIFARDHLDGSSAPLAISTRAHLAAEGFAADDWRITLVTNARVLGHVFNPVSLYLCRDATGTLRVVLAEVGNTHGERRVYTLQPAAADDATFRAEADKAMYVSPFVGMRARYRFRIIDDARLSVTIEEFEPETATDAPVLVAGFALDRRPLTTGWLARTLLRHPLITLATISLIHLHALRLWRLGVPFLRYGGRT